MPRTTVNLDATILRQLKRRAREEGKSLGQVISELSARGLAAEDRSPSRRFTWHAKAMRPKVDLEDKEAVRRALDES